MKVEGFGWFVCLFVYFFVCLEDWFVCLFGGLVCLFVCLFVCVCVFVCLFVCVSRLDCLPFKRCG